MRWITGGLGAAGLGGGVIVGGGLLRALHQPPSAPSGSTPLEPDYGGYGSIPPVSVPEPSALVLFGFACIAALLLNRRRIRRL